MTTGARMKIGVVMSVASSRYRSVGSRDGSISCKQYEYDPIQSSISRRVFFYRFFRFRWTTCVRILKVWRIPNCPAITREFRSDQSLNDLDAGQFWICTKLPNCSDIAIIVEEWLHTSTLRRERSIFWCENASWRQSEKSRKRDSIIREEMQCYAFFCDDAIEMQAIWVQATTCLLDLTSPLTAEPVDSFFTVCIHGRYRKDDGELAERTG